MKTVPETAINSAYRFRSHHGGSVVAELCKIEVHLTASKLHEECGRPSARIALFRPAENPDARDILSSPQAQSKAGALGADS
jgi:hypothetical protein